MCLAIPGKVVDLRSESATIDYNFERREASTKLVKPKNGDYVLVVGGMVVEIVPKKRAESMLKAWEEIQRE